ncbi:MAG: ABC-2 family transporter protein [Myxococcota bacterium]
MAPLLAAARARYRQLAAYAVANRAGAFTNGLFLVFRAHLFQACFDAGRIGGLTPLQATGYAAVTQALLMVCPQWVNVGLADTVRSGQIAVELLRPADFVWLHFAGRAGASAFYLVHRTLPLLVFAYAIGLAPAPSPWSLALCLVVVPLAAVVANALLFLVEVSSFWLESDRGVRYLLVGVALLPSGLSLPLSWFPAPVQALFLATPFPYTLHLPAEAFIGRIGPEQAVWAVGAQLAWAIGLVAASRWAFSRGVRRLVVLGG